MSVVTPVWSQKLRKHTWLPLQISVVSAVSVVAKDKINVELSVWNAMTAERMVLLSPLNLAGWYFLASSNAVGQYVFITVAKA